MNESKEIILEQWEEAKTNFDLLENEIHACDDARRDCLSRLIEAYDKNETQLAKELEKELKAHVEILEANRKRRNYVEETVLVPSLLNVCRFIDAQCGYVRRETLSGL